MSIVSYEGDSLEYLVNSGGQKIDIPVNREDTALAGGASPDYENYEMTLALDLEGGNQSIAIYKNDVFVFTASGATSTGYRVYKYPSGNQIGSTNYGNFGHANGVNFARNEFYSPVDYYPVIYSAKNTTPRYVTVNRVNINDNTLIRTLLFPATKNDNYTEWVGYSGQTAYDYKNKMLYTIGLKEWDNSVLTPVSGETETYELDYVSGFEIPTLNRSIMQGSQYHDGMIWISIGGTGQHPYVYAIDADNGDLLYTFDVVENRQSKAIEIEGFDFLDRFHMLVALQDSEFWLCTFGELEQEEAT